MATRIRLKRTGAKHNAQYRIVIMDQRRPRDGRTVEEIGYYDPNPDPATISVKKDRALYWLGVGAIPSDTVSSLLKRAGVFDADAPAAAEAPPAEAPAAEAPVAAEAEQS